MDFECVRKFCYLEDMISETGGAGQASGYESKLCLAKV